MLKGLTGAKPTPKPKGQPILTHAQNVRLLDCIDTVLDTLMQCKAHLHGYHAGMITDVTVEGLGGIIAQVKDALSELQALKYEANSNL